MFISSNGSIVLVNDNSVELIELKLFQVSDAWNQAQMISTLLKGKTNNSPNNFYELVLLNSLFQLPFNKKKKLSSLFNYSSLMSAVAYYIL